MTTPRRFSAASFHSAAWRGALIGILCALVCWCLNGTSFVRTLENRESDSCFLFRGPRASTANVIIVAMDEVSLQEIDKPLLFFSPELAKVVTYLHDQGAASIGVDFLLPASEKTMEDLQPGRRGDLAPMGQAIGQAGNVVLPEWLSVGEQPLRPPFEWSIPSDRPWADLGFVDQTVDSDACLRRQELRRQDDEGLHACLALALLMKARGLSEQWLATPQLQLDGAAIPVDANGCLRINYVGPADTIRTVSFRDVLAAAEGRADATTTPFAGAQGRATPGKMPFVPQGRATQAPADFKDSIVLIGMTRAASKDTFFTPYTSQSLLQSMRSTDLQMSGIEIHANVLATLMDRAYITTPWFLATPLMLLVVGGVLGAILIRCSLEMGALVTLAHHFAWRALAVGAFCMANWRVEMMSMFVLGVLIYGTIFAMRWRWIRRMMGMVKSEAVARALEAGGPRLDLRGEQREITVLFCDIRNFTSFSERHSAHEVVQLLNAFFAVAVPAIEAEGGTVNQYIGDAVMVIFGAPQPQHDHAVRAVRAAIEVVRRVHSMADRWKELGADQFRIGVGIHTGKAVVGTVGSPRRLDYTAIGDTVNTAARLESANKELQSEVLISQATFDALPEDEKQRIADLGEPKALSVKGKQEALLVYSVV